MSSNDPDAFEEGIFKDMMQQMVSAQPVIGYPKVFSSIFFNTFIPSMIKYFIVIFLSIQMHFPAIATSPGSCEIIVISFRPFNGRIAKAACLSRFCIPNRFPIVRKVKISDETNYRHFFLVCINIFIRSRAPFILFFGYFIRMPGVIHQDKCLKIVLVSYGYRSYIC